MGKLFGTDGIRGIANVKLTGEFAYLIGRCGAYVLSKKSQKVKKIIVGMDTRISSPMLEHAICSGISSYGVEVIKVSYVPTPAIAYLIQKHNLIGGIMISASHNPFEYNGIKFFDENGVKLSDELEEQIENLYFDGGKSIEYIPSSIGEINYTKDIIDDYEKFLLSFLDGISLEGLKIALDCANGSAYFIAEEVFKNTGAEVLVINNHPNGININNNCGSTNMDSLCKFVVENKCDFGFAYDGDADRCLAVDNEGNIINGDFIMGIISIYFKEKGILKGNTLVTTVMSNIGLYKSLEEYEIETSKVCVGDKYVFQNMNENGYVVGGEQSGHIILFNNKTGDGILTSIVLSKIIKEKNKSLKELSSSIKEFPQILVNVNVNGGNKKIYNENEEIIGLIKNYENELSSNGRILVRDSGTEDLIRIMIEGKDIEVISKMANHISDAIESKLIKNV